MSVRIPLRADRIMDTELSSAPQTFQLAEVKIKQWSFSLACGSEQVSAQAQRCSQGKPSRKWTWDAEKRPSDSSSLL